MKCKKKTNTYGTIIKCTHVNSHHLFCTFELHLTKNKYIFIFLQLFFDTLYWFLALIIALQLKSEM